MTTTIMLPTWSLGGLVLNQIDSNGVEWIVEEYEGWDNAPGPRLGMQDKVAAHGSYDSDAYLEPRMIVLEGHLCAPTRSAMDAALRQLATLSLEVGRFDLTVTEPDWVLTSEVRLARKTQTSRISTTYAAFQVTLIAPDPRKYSTTLNSVSTGLGTPPTGGVLWNGTAGSTGVEWAGPAGGTGVVWQTGPGLPGVVTVANAGTAAATLQFIITDTAEPVVNPSIRNQGTGQLITYGGTIPQGSTLAIDADPEGASVLLDGTNRGPNLTRAEFFTVPANSSIQVEFFSSASAPGASLQVRWRDTYL